MIPCRVAEGRGASIVALPPSVRVRPGTTTPFALVPQENCDKPRRWRNVGHRSVVEKLGYRRGRQVIGNKVYYLHQSLTPTTPSCHPQRGEGIRADSALSRLY